MNCHAVIIAVNLYSLSTTSVSVGVSSTYHAEGNMRSSLKCDTSMLQFLLKGAIFALLALYARNTTRSLWPLKTRYTNPIYDPLHYLQHIYQLAHNFLDLTICFLGLLELIIRMPPQALAAALVGALKTTIYAFHAFLTPKSYTRILGVLTSYLGIHPKN